MAAITQRPFLRHLQATPTTYVQRLRNGVTKDEGVGIRFWFRPISTEVSEVPVDERELPLMFRGRTHDFQVVSVQATVTYRIVNPSTAVDRVDFSIDTATGYWRSTPLEQVGGLLTELSQQYALGVLGTLDVTEATVQGPALLRSAIAEGLGLDLRLEEMGISIVGVRVVAVRPSRDLEMALETPIVEQLQQEADRARFDRRARGVEHERAISENELQNEIALARRAQKLVEQEGTNERKRATEASEADRIRAAGSARDSLVVAESSAEGIEAVGLARARTEKASLEAYAELSEAMVLGLAVKELAGNLPSIETLVLAPDMLSTVAAKLGIGHG